MSALIEEALGLCGHAARQGGPAQLLDTLAGRLRVAQEKTRAWMAYAQCVTDYDAAREAVEEE